MDRREEAQIAFTTCELIEQIRILLEQRYFNEFREINSGVMADMNKQLDLLFSSDSE